jgi:peptidoglycan/xylan/chitin deacetylase (PgdA/CDA1 family)
MGIGGKYLAPVTRKLDGSLTVFAFHNVSDHPAPFTEENGISVPVDLFEKQMEFIAENFNVISAGSWLKGEVPKRAALVTFDDGYAGIFKNALPILSGMSLPSVVFMNMAPVFAENYWAERVMFLCQKVSSFQEFLAERGIATVQDAYRAHLECTLDLVESYEAERGDAYKNELPAYIEPYASPEDLEDSAGNPLVSLGSHSYDHFNIKKLSDEALAEQYQKNHAALSRYKGYLPLFAFPFGQPGSCFSPAQVRVLEQNGALRFFTAWPRPNADPAARVLDRINLGPAEDCDRRLWFPIVKYPILEAFSSTRAATGFELSQLLD